LREAAHKFLLALAAAAGVTAGVWPAPPEVLLPVTDMDSACRAALYDLTHHVSEYHHKQTRYLALYQVPVKERHEWVRVILDFALNKVSGGGRPARARFVTGTDRALVAYDWDPKVWENLARASRYGVDKKVKTETEVQVKVVEKRVKLKGEDGKYLRTKSGAYKYKTVREEVATGQNYQKQYLVETIGSWIDPEAAKALTGLTGSVMPVVLAPEFIVQATDCTKAPHYYDFLKIGKTEADLWKLIDGDPQTSARLRSDRQGVIVLSGVTQKNRRLSRVPTRNTSLSAYYWFSTDAKADTAAQNYLQILLDRGADNFDATEQIFRLKNGLQGYALFNNKGERQDSAPDFIANDKSTTNNDGRVRNGVSCIRCHETGILRFKSVYPQLRKSVKIYAANALDLLRIEELYGEGCADELDADIAAYDKAVRRLTGLPPAVVHRAYSRAFHLWDERPVTAAVAALDLGVPEETFKEVLRELFGDREAHKGYTNRMTLLALIADEPVGVSRSQWTEAFPEAATIFANRRRAAAAKAAAARHPPRGAPPEGKKPEGAQP
jgi:hypothetical protein